MHRPILFGAFDRHNLGDLLFPHLLAPLLRRRCRFAGLVERDLRAVGGHRVRRLIDLPASEGPVLHVGGELLTCTAWEAAVMLLEPPEAAQAVVGYLEDRPAERQAWVRACLGLTDEAPYVAAREGSLFVAVGGVTLDTAPPALRDEVLDKLRRARAVTVRERTTLRHLQEAGIPATLLPDAAVTVARHGPADPPPLGRRGDYLAVQCSREFGDDRTLDTLAEQLGIVARTQRWPVVLWRAGAAPWHDDLPTLRRLAVRLVRAGVTVQVFDSLHVRRICALIAHAGACCASSLHARIVAMAHARPRVTIASPVGTPRHDKHGAFVETWESAAMPGVVPAAHVAAALQTALATDALTRRQTARTCEAAFDAGFERLREALAA